MALVLCMLAGQAPAATYTWTVATGSAANGSGTWNTTNTNWWNGSSATTWANNSGASADIASFTAASPTTSSTVTLGSTLNVAAVYFGTGTYTLSSGTLAIVDSGTIGYNTTNTATIASAITGNNISIVNTANSSERTINLSGSNQLTGTTSINTKNTRVNIQNASAFGTSTIDLGTNGGIYLAASGTYANNIRIGLDLYSGNRSAVRFDASGVTLTGTITMMANSAITSNGVTVNTIAGPITESGGARNLTFNGNVAGQYILSGASTYTGSTALILGSITLAGGDDRLPATTTLSLGATAKLILGGNSQTLGGLINTATGSVVGGNSTASSLILNVASGTNTFSGAVGGAGTNENNLSLRKRGAGTFEMSGTSSFTGATTIEAGVLSITGTSALQGTSGLTIAGGAGLTYTGGAATFGKSVTVTAGSGTGTIRNSGGGLLTLSGNLSKNNSVLRLTGGAFDVTGLISGTTAGTSDLVMDGTSSVKLSAANTYNGPTFVIESSTLTYGVNNAIPSNSVVNLGNASSQGALSMNGFTGAIGGLTFGSSGGTLQLAATSTSAPVLTAANGTMALTNGTIDLAGSGSTAGLYRVLSAQSISGSFAPGSINNAPVNYSLLYTGTAVDLQMRANQATTFAMTTGTVSRVFMNTTVAVSGTVSNSSPVNAASLVLGLGATGQLTASNFTTGSVAAGSVLAVSGSINAGSTLGSRTWTVVNTDNDAITATSTVTGSLTVLDNRTVTAASANFGVVRQGSSGSQSFALTSTQLDSEYTRLTVGNGSGGGFAVTGSSGFVFDGSGGSSRTLSGSFATAGALSGTITLTNASAETGGTLTGQTPGTTSVSYTASVFDGRGTWNQSSGGSWGSQASSNWTSTGNVGAAPGTFGSGFTNTDIAEFGTTIGSGTGTITLDGAQVSLASLSFTNTAGRYVIQKGTGSGSLTLAASAGKPFISVLGTHEIATAILGTSGLQKTGIGKLILSGSNSYTGGTEVAGGTLAVNGSIAGNVSVLTGAELGGSGVIAGNIGGDGLIGPGNSPGILTVQGKVDPTATTSFAFEFMQQGDPIWSAATASKNDVLQLTNAAPFVNPLTSTNFVNIYFEVASLAKDDIFRGGFFSNYGSGVLDFGSAIGTPTYQYYVLGSGSGTHGYNGKYYYTFDEYKAANVGLGITGVTASVVTSGTADFSGGTIYNGQVTQFVIIPEPDTIVFAGIGIAMAGWSLWKRRRIAQILQE